MKIHVTEADGFARRSQDADLAVVVISRADVEACRVGSTVQRLMLFSDDAAQVHRFAGRMMLAVEGYDADPRPLVLIPECVRFFRALDAQWNHWLHFLVPEPDQLQLMVLMLVDVEVGDRCGPLTGYRLRHPEQLVGVLERLFSGMNELHEAFDVPEARNEAMTAAVIAALGLPA
jgi:hypothetical protein